MKVLAVLVILFFGLSASVHAQDDTFAVQNVSLFCDGSGSLTFIGVIPNNNIILYLLDGNGQMLQTQSVVVTTSPLAFKFTVPITSQSLYVRWQAGVTPITGVSQVINCLTPIVPTPVPSVIQPPVIAPVQQAPIQITINNPINLSQQQNPVITNTNTNNNTNTQTQSNYQAVKITAPSTGDGGLK